MKFRSGYRNLFAALPESGAGPRGWTAEECRRVQQALRKSGLFKQTWLRAAAFRMIEERLRALETSAGR